MYLLSPLFELSLFCELADSQKYSFFAIQQLKSENVLLLLLEQQLQCDTISKIRCSIALAYEFLHIFVQWQVNLLWFPVISFGFLSLNQHKTPQRSTDVTNGVFTWQAPALFTILKLVKVILNLCLNGESTQQPSVGLKILRILNLCQNRLNIKNWQQQVVKNLHMGIQISQSCLDLQLQV